ncbi:DNA primase [Desulfovibrio inopinatus]|uniref:DNA primase n=1 Tax=Desulfovibrio inopinatus TaxID=102109 RepID=UPI00041E949E|nr:DNA primase [Desulfovibrio inopinatus]
MADTIAEVKERIDIADIVRRYVELRPVGGRLVGVCPFHHETKGSFNVHSDKGFYHCFGCQASGDVIDFYSRINGLGFREALEQLAAEAGVELDRAPNPEAGAKRKKRKTCLAMHELAAAFYREELVRPGGSGAVEYLKARGMDGKTAKVFGLGYAPDAWRALEQHLERHGFTPAEMVEAGLLVERDGKVWDRFRGRVMFPIADISGQVVAFGARILRDGEPKYLNSADSPIYKKGNHLYGLFQARPTLSRTRSALVTEGYMDVVTLHQFGFTNACGVLGTALTPNQTKRLAGLCTTVTLLFDGDAPGRTAARKSAEMFLAAGLTCRVALMPEGEDVDSLLQSHGKVALDERLEAALDGLEYCLEMVKRDLAPKEMVAWVRNFFAGLADTGLAAAYIPKVALGLGMAEAELRTTVLGRAAVKPPTAATQTVNTRAAKTASVRRDETEIVEFAIRHPETIGDLAEKGTLLVLSSDFMRHLWDKLVVAAKCNQIAELFSRLDEAERAFWAQCELKGPMSEKDMQTRYAEIVRFIAKMSRKQMIRDVLEAMRHARASGDARSEKELFAQYMDLLGGDNEQPQRNPAD